MNAAVPPPSDRLELGIELMPDMPISEAIETVKAAERLGYAYCVITDEGFMHDPYVLLGALAGHTHTIRLGPATNGYTRHPAATAAALASLQELSQGRAIAMLVAGGSMTLSPMGISRAAPLTVVRETIEVLRRLWTGETVNWKGQRYVLDRAKLAMGAQHIPLWLAARGAKMLELAGEMADGVVLMGKSDLGPALSLVEKGSSGRRDKPVRVYLDRIACQPEMLKQAAVLYAYTLVDAPPRMLASLGVSEETSLKIRERLGTRGPEAASLLVSEDMIRRLQISGTPEECGLELQALIRAHQLDVFLLDIFSADLQKNVSYMAEMYQLVHGDGVEGGGTRGSGHLALRPPNSCTDFEKETPPCHPD
jgi:5,10-methylenetetrahydromethanopterin reductase